jgi:hypothetical protein
MIPYNTEDFKETMGESGVTNKALAHLQVYHLSRCADALERIATQLEDGMIATLHGQDTVNQIHELVSVTRDK